MQGEELIEEAAVDDEVVMMDNCMDSSVDIVTPDHFHSSHTCQM